MLLEPGVVIGQRLPAEYAGGEGDWVSDLVTGLSEVLEIDQGAAVRRFGL